MFARRENDSDDEGSDGERHLPVKRDDEEYEPSQKKRNNIWSDVVMEQSLLDKADMATISRDKKMMVNRGAESYSIPPDLLDKKEEDTPPKTPIFTVTPPSDDPFSLQQDLPEKFGVEQARGRGGRQRGGRGQWKPFRSQIGVNADSTSDEALTNVQKTDVDSMDADAATSGAGDESSSSRGRGAVRSRGARGWGPRGRGRGGNFVPRGMKRSWTGRVNDPTELLDKGYSMDTLMAAEFQEGIPLEQLGDDMALALGERDPETIRKIAIALGELKALELFEETRQVEASGGMRTLDGSRRRTPGGVFIMLFKSDMDVTAEVKDAIFEDNKKKQRQVMRAKRRGTKLPKDFGESLKQMSELLKQKKEADAEKTEVNSTVEKVNPDDEELDHGEMED